MHGVSEERKGSLRTPPNPVPRKVGCLWMPRENASNGSETKA